MRVRHDEGEQVSCLHAVNSGTAFVGAYASERSLHVAPFEYSLKGNGLECRATRTNVSVGVRALNCTASPAFRALVHHADGFSAHLVPHVF